MTDQLIAMGANLTSIAGKPQETLIQAVNFLSKMGLVIRSVSRFYATPCFPAGAGPDYVNAALRVRSDLDAKALLDLLHETENRFGRTRTQRWAGRSLDLDLIACGDLVTPDHDTVDHWITLPIEQQARVAPDQMVLPHPRIQDRGFVLVPLADVAPDWQHPILQRSVKQMLDALPSAELRDIRPL